MARVASENNIGILKGGFQILRDIPLVLDNTKRSLVNILHIIKCCVILHNYLTAFLFEDVPDGWTETDDPEDVVSDIAEATGEDYLGAEITPDDMKDQRRNKLFKAP